MQLREHPLMSYRGIPNWPPVWSRGYFDQAKTVHGEVGILKGIVTHEALPNRCYLAIDHEEREYVGSLLFDDAAFCSQVAHLLEFYRGCSIKEIGDVDLEFTL
jgi:hypothetical protein